MLAVRAGMYRLATSAVLERAGDCAALGIVQEEPGNVEYILAFWERLGWQVRLVRVAGVGYGGIIRHPRYSTPTPNGM